MADGTKIEWTDATVNAVNGCSVVSPGCTNCYAMRLAGTRLRNHPSRPGLTIDTKAGPVWNGKVDLRETALLQPLSWRRPRRIFWNAHGDLFHPSVPDAWIDRQFGVMAQTPQHIHQVLTKRPNRMRQWAADPSTPRRVWDAACELRDPTWALAQQGAAWGGQAPWPLLNVWMGTSVEDQTRADERIPDLIGTPAAVRFLSCEPLLGQLDLSQWLRPRWPDCNCLFPVAEADTVTDRNGVERCPVCNVALGGDPEPPVHWVIVGGESGPRARLMRLSWARLLRDQCGAAGVAYFLKQWGEWVPAGQASGQPIREFAYVEEEQHRYHRIGKKAAGRLLDGVLHDGMPA